MRFTVRQVGRGGRGLGVESCRGFHWDKERALEMDGRYHTAVGVCLMLVNSEPKGS